MRKQIKSHGKITNKFRCHVTSHIDCISSIYVRPYKLEQPSDRVIGPHGAGRTKELQGIENDFVVKDDIGQDYMNVISLWQFGQTY